MADVMELIDWLSSISDSGEEPRAFVCIVLTLDSKGTFNIHDFTRLPDSPFLVEMSMLSYTLQSKVHDVVEYYHAFEGGVDGENPL